MQFKDAILSLPIRRIRLNDQSLTSGLNLQVFISSVSGKILQIIKLSFSLLKPRQGFKERNLEQGSSLSRKPGFLPNTRKVIKGTVVVIILVLLVLVLLRILTGGLFGSNDKSVGVAQELNKEFTFPLKNEVGEEVSRVKYLIEKAELRDEIIVKGQKATAIKGRVFLILTLKITNEYKQSIQIESRDYVRLSVNGNENEWLAPEFHSDPVEVQAISIKYIRVGFPINTADTNLILQVGEIGGEKERVVLNLN